MFGGLGRIALIRLFTKQLVVARLVLDLARLLLNACRSTPGTGPNTRPNTLNTRPNTPNTSNTRPNTRPLSVPFLFLDKLARLPGSVVQKVYFDELDSTWGLLWLRTSRWQLIIAFLLYHTIFILSSYKLISLISFIF